MDKDKIIESLVYDTVLAAMRAQLAVDDLTVKLAEATAVCDQSNQAAETVAAQCGVDIAAIRDQIAMNAAL
jgi:hypothetical protein